MYRVQECSRVSLRAVHRAARAAIPHVSMRHAGVRSLLNSRWVRRALRRRLVLDLHGRIQYHNHSMCARLGIFDDQHRRDLPPQTRGPAMALRQFVSATTLHQIVYEIFPATADEIDKCCTRELCTRALGGASAAGCSCAAIPAQLRVPRRMASMTNDSSLW